MTQTTRTIADKKVSERFRALLVLICCVAFGLVAFQTDDLWRSLTIISFSYITTFITFVALFLIIHFVYNRLLHMWNVRADKVQDSGNWYRTYFSRFPLVDNIVALIAFIITSTCFSAHKAKVVGADGFVYDDLFIQWDRALFLGHDAWMLTHRLVPNATLTKWIDQLYHPLFLPMVLGYVLCFSTRARTDLRYTYMLTYLTSFVVIGMIMAAQLSSVGPVFYDTLISNGSVFTPLLDRLDLHAEIAGPFTSVLGRTYLLNLHHAQDVGFFGGISAMPSMHIALAYMWAFAAWRIHRGLGLVTHVYAAIIWIGSVHLGWHYFVDGLVSIIVLAIIWNIFGRKMGLYRQAQVIRATT